MLLRCKRAGSGRAVGLLLQAAAVGAKFEERCVPSGILGTAGQERPQAWGWRARRADQILSHTAIWCGVIRVMSGVLLPLPAAVWAATS